MATVLTSVQKAAADIRELNTNVVANAKKIEDLQIAYLADQEAKRKAAEEAGNRLDEEKERLAETEQLLARRKFAAEIIKNKSCLDID